MKTHSLLIYLSILKSIYACKSDEHYFENAICITNINTIDSEDGIKKRQTIILKEDKIFKITNSDEIKLSKENMIIDGTGKFLIPGLWDAHMHFSYIEELAPRMFNLFLANTRTKFT